MTRLDEIRPKFKIDRGQPFSPSPEALSFLQSTIYDSQLMKPIENYIRDYKRIDLSETKPPYLTFFQEQEEWLELTANYILQETSKPNREMSLIVVLAIYLLTDPKKPFEFIYSHIRQTRNLDVLLLLVPLLKSDPYKKIGKLRRVSSHLIQLRDPHLVLNLLPSFLELLYSYHLDGPFKAKEFAEIYEIANAWKEKIRKLIDQTQFSAPSFDEYIELLMNFETIASERSWRELDESFENMRSLRIDADSPSHSWLSKIKEFFKIKK